MLARLFALTGFLPMLTSRFAAVAATLALLLPWAARGADTAATAAAVKQTLQQRFPDIKIVDVQATPAAGLFEVFTGDSIAYATADGDYVILGSLMDTRTKKDLTAAS